MSEEPEIVALGAAFAGPQANDDTQEKQPLHAKKTTQIAFNRMELATILNLYGSKVAAGEWRDYAMDFSRERAVFAVFRSRVDQLVAEMDQDVTEGLIGTHRVYNSTFLISFRRLPV